MSGHSKWSTIKRQKGATDQKRGALFTKLSQAITVAVKQGGGVTDPASNFRLRLAIESARVANMPNDNIDRAVQRALGKDEELAEVLVYEGFGPGGFSVIVESLTDNKNRTGPEIRSLFEKSGGSFANPGAVSHLFHQLGEIHATKDRGVDELFLLAADSGADDIEEVGDHVVVYTKPEKLQQVRESLEAEGIVVISASLTRKPAVEVKAENEDTYKNALDFLQKLEDHPDVSEVYANIAIEI